MLAQTLQSRSSGRVNSAGGFRCRASQHPAQGKSRDTPFHNITQGLLLALLRAVELHAAWLMYGAATACGQLPPCAASGTSSGWVVSQRGRTPGTLFSLPNNATKLIWFDSKEIAAKVGMCYRQLGSGPAGNVVD